MQELASGFRLVTDPARGLITFDSLRRNASLLGLGGMSNDDLRGMLAEGDFDGDGALSEMEFCVVMVRLSPGGGSTTPSTRRPASSSPARPRRSPASTRLSATIRLHQRTRKEWATLAN
jgi:hypothetical protein